MRKKVRKEANQKNFCLAGGVALNCVANARICVKEFSIESGFNQHQVMLEVRLAPRSSPGMNTSLSRARPMNGKGSALAPFIYSLF